MIASKVDLTAYAFLDGLTSPQQDFLADHGVPVEFPAGHTIGRAGEPASRFYLVERGVVRLEAFVSERGPVTIGLVSAGEPFGWSSLVPPFRLHYDIIAVENVAAIALDAARIREMCATDDDFASRFYAKLNILIASRLQATRLQLIGACIGTPESKGWV